METKIKLSKREACRLAGISYHDTKNLLVKKVGSTEWRLVDHRGGHTNDHSFVEIFYTSGDFAGFACAY